MRWTWVVWFSAILLGAHGARAMGSDKPGATTQATVSVAVNAAVAGNVYKGWPVTVEAVVANVEAGDLQITVTDAGGAAVQWALQRAGGAKPDAGGFASVYWVMDGSTSAKLGDGDYQVSVREVHGKDIVAESAAAEVTVAAAPSGDDATDQQMMLSVQYASILGHDADAAQMTADWVLRRPQSVQANTANGDLALMAGRLDDAMQAYQTALKLARQQSKQHSKEPPRELMQRINAVMREMEKREDQATTQPAGKR